MYFVYNSKTREVIGLYNMRDVPAWLNLNEYTMPISDEHAENIMLAQIWECKPYYLPEVGDNAEVIYREYIRRGIRD